MIWPEKSHCHSLKNMIHWAGKKIAFQGTGFRGWKSSPKKKINQKFPTKSCSLMLRYPSYTFFPSLGWRSWIGSKCFQNTFCCNHDLFSAKFIIFPVFLTIHWGFKNIIMFEPQKITSWQFCDRDPFGMVETWPFQRLSDLQLGDTKVTLNHRLMAFHWILVV